MADFPDLYGRLAYFECADGWEPLLRDLGLQIGWSDKNIARGRVITRAVQVKQKFGSLTFYTATDVVGPDENDALGDVRDHAAAYLAGLRAMASFVSLRTCEACGLPGTLGGPGWSVSVLCPVHRDGRTKTTGG